MLQPKRSPSPKEEESEPRGYVDDDLDDILNMNPGHYRENLMRGVVAQKSPEKKKKIIIDKSPPKAKEPEPTVVVNVEKKI